MPARWIDFRALKEQVPIREVLARYGLLEKLREKGPGKLVGRCPIHGGSNDNAFHVNAEKNVFNCFAGCGGGNVLDFVSKMEKCGVREAGEKLATWFGLQFSRSEGSAKGAMPEARSAPKASPPRVSATVNPDDEVINPPLLSPLTTLDATHPYLAQRGLKRETVTTFGVGFCTRGLMKNRIAIEIRNERAEIVAYGGRAIDDQLARDEGKFKLPRAFAKGHVVYNLFRAKEHARSGIIVCEGFFDTMRIHQAGYPNVVALMGASMSDHQEQLLLKTTDRLVLMLDGDEAGVAGTRNIYDRLRRKIFLKEIHLENGEQPDNLTEERLKELLRV